MLLTTVFMLMFISAPFVMVWMLRLSGERANRISLINIVTYSIYIFSVLGTFPLFFMLDEYRVYIGVVNNEQVFYVLLYSVVCIVFLLLGVIFVRKVIGLNSSGAFDGGINKLSQKRILILTSILLVLMTILYSYAQKLDSIAIFVAIKDSVVDAALSRSEMGNNLTGGGAHWYTLFLTNYGSMVTYTLLTAWLVDRRKFLLALFLLSFSFSSFVAVMATEKAPFINLLTSIVMTYYVVKKRGVIPFASLLYLGLISLGILIIFYMLFMGAPTVGDALGNVVSRAFSGSITPAYFYLEYYPHVGEYLLGRTFPNPGNIMPFTPVRYTVDLMNWVFPELAASGVVGTMPTVFWGEAYINFGMIGVPVVSFIVGILLSLVTHFIFLFEINPISIGLYVWLIDHYKKLSITGFSGYIYDFNLIGVVLFVLVMLILSGSLVIKKQHPNKNH